MHRDLSELGRAGARTGPQRIVGSGLNDAKRGFLLRLLKRAGIRCSTAAAEHLAALMAGPGAPFAELGVGVLDAISVEQFLQEVAEGTTLLLE